MRRTSRSPTTSRSDTNFYHWGPWLKKSDNSWPHGYITGSGQPMKFVRADGTVLPLYQQLTELVDEQLTCWHRFRMRATKI